MDISIWDGALSLGDFRLAAFSFMEKWKSIMSDFPPWSWVPCAKQPLVASHDVEGYLSLENIILRSIKEERDELSCPRNEETSCSENDEPIDVATLVQGNCSEVPFYDLHIVYSASYRVPVLFFRAYHSDGKTLVFNEIEKYLPAHSTKVLLDSKWTFITQEMASNLRILCCGRGASVLHTSCASSSIESLISEIGSLISCAVLVAMY